MRQQILSYLVRFRRGVSAFCAGLAALILFNALATKDVPTHPVLRATHSLSAGKMLLVSDFEVGQLPTEFSWAGVLSEATQAIGQVTSHSIAADAPLTLSDFVGPNLLNGFPVGTVAIALPNMSEASASSVETGDHVDIYATSSGTEVRTTKIANNVTVVSQTSSDTSLSAIGSKGALMVAVNPAQARALVENMGQSTFTLALLNHG